MFGNEDSGLQRIRDRFQSPAQQTIRVTRRHRRTAPECGAVIIRPTAVLMTYAGMKGLDVRAHLVVPVPARSTEAKEVGNPIFKVLVECIADVGCAGAEGSGRGKGLRVL